MRIDLKPCLDFKDVLIPPCRTSMCSRSDVNLHREFTFKHSPKKVNVVPIIASNMHATGTFETYAVLQRYRMLTCMSKHLTLKDYANYMINSVNETKALKDLDLPEGEEPPVQKYPPLDPDLFMISAGIREGDLETLAKIVEFTGCNWICIDIANGHMKRLVDYCAKIRERFPDKIIVAGNVAAPDVTEELLEDGGVDVVKLGIGSGCFAGDTRILMANGMYKNIEDIEVGEHVINKRGKSVQVINKFNKGIRKTVNIRANNWHDWTTVTKHHKYFVGDMSTSSSGCITSSGKAKILDKKTRLGKSKFKWKKLSEINEKEMTLLMPNKVKWNLSKNFKIDLGDFVQKCIVKKNTVTSTASNRKTFNRYMESGYDLGYIFGTFLGDGDARMCKNGSGSVHWSFGAHETEIGDKLKKCVKNVLGYDCSSNIKKENVLAVHCYNNCFARVMLKFSKKTNKHLPEEYYCNNKKYIQGIFDGLVDSDGSVEKTPSGKFIYTLTNTSKRLLEVFYWCCISLGVTYSAREKEKTVGTLKNIKFENLQDSYRIKTHTFNRKTKKYVYSEIFEKEKGKSQVVWDIEVDCPTHSFIANNAIVHNSACLTRRKTGVGVPQLTAVDESSDTAHKVNGHIISDGGITCPGDASKAFVAGADFVMLGGVFAGHDESYGELTVGEDGKQYKEFYGMSSSHAIQKHYGKQEKYRASEGRHIKIPYKGPLEGTVLDYLGGIRSTCTYIDARRIKDMSKCGKVRIVGQQINNHFNA